MYIGAMVLGGLLILALAWFIFIKASKLENLTMRVIGFVIAGLLALVIIAGPWFAMGARYGGGAGIGGGMGGMSSPMMSGGGMAGGMMGGMGGSSGGAMSGGMSCPMMSSGGMGAMGSGQKMDPNMIPIQGTIMNGKNGAMVSYPMIDGMRDNLMKSDFFVQEFAKSVVSKPDFYAKLKAQLEKAEKDSKEMMK